MQAATSRKRKRVPGKHPRVVGDILDSLETQRREGGVRPVAAPRTQTVRSLSPYHVDLEWEGLAELEDDDTEDCIVVKPRK